VQLPARVCNRFVRFAFALRQGRDKEQKYKNKTATVPSGRHLDPFSPRQQEMVEVVDIAPPRTRARTHPRAQPSIVACASVPLSGGARHRQPQRLASVHEEDK
jgi:hypothetical protein